jgi:hypothetical protein
MSLWECSGCLVLGVRGGVLRVTQRMRYGLEMIERHPQWQFSNHQIINIYLQYRQVCLPDKGQCSQVANHVKFYPMLLAHLLDDDLNTWKKLIKQSRGFRLNTTLNKHILQHSYKKKTQFHKSKLTNQSFEVIHNSSRLTTPSSNSFFRAEPIYKKQ